MMKYIAAMFGIIMATSAMAQPLHVTGTVGTHTAGAGEAVVGLAVGMDFHKNLRVEAAYEYDVDNKKNNLFTYVQPQALIPGTNVTPYVLVGVGANLDSLDNRPMYALGGGMRVELTKTIDLDLRYRHINNTERNDKREVITTGVSVKF